MKPVRMTRLFQMAAMTVCLGWSTWVPAADFVLVNINLPGEGLNDATPRSPEGGNPGTTLGELRRNVFNHATQIWGRQLHSVVPIRVRAQFIAMACTADDADLGEAGALGAAANFPLVPFPNRAYPIALANALHRADLSPATDDIQAQFNSVLDSNPNCLDGGGWWYGLDPEVPVPAGKVALLPVVVHELGHGLGFQSLVSTLTGTPFTFEMPRFTDYLFDQQAGIPWSQMSDSQRLASQVNDPHLVWNGPRGISAVASQLGFEPRVTVSTPQDIAGVYPAQRATFGHPVPLETIPGSVVLADDGSGSGRDACEPLVNADAMAGRVALVERGSCDFTTKAQHAQNAGAIAILVFNNVPDGLPGMGGVAPALTVPAYGISQSLGQAILVQPAPVQLVLGYDSSRLSGAHPTATPAKVRMHAPFPVEHGSSVSHFAPDAFPDQLMEPSLTGQRADREDLTLDVLRDLGWQTDTLLRNGLDPAPLR